MEVATGNLTMIGLNTETPSVFWNGVKVSGVVGIRVENAEGTQKVVLTVQENPVLSEMRAAGVKIVRAGA